MVSTHMIFPQVSRVRHHYPLTLFSGESVIRAALFNHRIEQEQIDHLFDSVIEFGREFEKEGLPAEAYVV